MVQVVVGCERQANAVEGLFAGFDPFLLLGGMPHVVLEAIAEEGVNEHLLTAAIEHDSFVRQVGDRDLRRRWALGSESGKYNQ